MAQTLFISDLHLSASTPDSEQALSRLLTSFTDLDALYILGDFFEYWVGDDDDSPLIQRVCDALNRCRDAGTRIFLLRGNRDFALGTEFAARCGATLLPDDEVVIDLYDQPTLLLHGDTLCTDDTEYQSIRATVRSPQWLAEMLAKPLSERRAFAEAMRQASKAKAENDPDNIVDVNPDAVESALQRHSVSRMIHGHTHRPQHHQHAHGERWVLGDWTRERGAVVAVAAREGVRLTSLALV